MAGKKKFIKKADAASKLTALTGDKKPEPKRTGAETRKKLYGK